MPMSNHRVLGWSSFGTDTDPDNVTDLTPLRIQTMNYNFIPKVRTVPDAIDKVELLSFASGKVNFRSTENLSHELGQFKIVISDV